MKKIIIKTLKAQLLIVGLFFSFQVSGQDIHFSQAEFLPLHLNPALAGGQYDLSANLNYKTQWKSVATPYQTFGASISSILNPSRNTRSPVKLAAGLDFYSDWAGDVKMSTNFARVHFATHVRIGENSTIGVGLYAGYGSQNVDLERAKWGSQYDGDSYNPLMPSGENLVGGGTSSGVFDIGTGALYSYSTERGRAQKSSINHINIGFAAYHLNRPRYYFYMASDEKMYMRFSAFINTSFNVSETKFAIEPSIYFHSQGPAKELLLGAYAKYRFQESSQRTVFVDEIYVSFGLFYRNLDALIVKAYFDWKGLGIGFAYDFNVFNSLKSYSSARGGAEFSLRYVIQEFERRPYTRGGRLLF